LHLAARAQAAQVDDEKTSGLEYPGHLGRTPALTG
jgi:hypothetical protein